MSNFLIRISQWVVHAIVYVFNMIISAMLVVLDSLLTALSDMIPGVDISTAVFAPYVAVVNSWVPVDFGFMLLSTFLSIELVVLVYRTIKKHIPTLA